jgi:hypothetical protein
MERIAIVDFFDDRESVALRHTGTDPDSIYSDIESAFEAEGFDTITLFTRDELIAERQMTADEIDALATLVSLR